MDNREIKIHVYAKRKTWICTIWPSFPPHFPFTLYCFYTKISSFMPVLTTGIVRDCFYLLIFYSEKFSTWVWRLPFAVNVNLNLSNFSNSTFVQLLQNLLKQTTKQTKTKETSSKQLEKMGLRLHFIRQRSIIMFLYCVKTLLLLILTCIFRSNGNLSLIPQSLGRIKSVYIQGSGFAFLRIRNSCCGQAGREGMGRERK